MSLFECLTSGITGQKSSDVKSLRPKWPRGQNFGLGLDAFLWPRPRPQTFGLSLASISLSYYVIGHFSGKNRVKVRNFVNFSGNNLKSYVVNHYLVLFYNYFWPRPWPQPLEISLGLVALALALASRFWPRLTSVQKSCQKLSVFVWPLMNM